MAHLTRRSILRGSAALAATRLVAAPHIAKAAGVKPEGMSAFFEEWLVPGAKAFVSRRWPDAAEASEIIHDAKRR